MAVHATARDRNGAPGSALHFKRTERSLVSSVAFAALVYSDWWQDRKIVHLCIDRTSRVSPNYHHSPRMSPCCTRVVTQGSSAAALGAFYSAELARYRQFCNVSSCFFPIMQG